MSDFEPHDPLGYLRQQVAEREHKIREILLDLETDKAIRELQSTNGWKQLAESLRAMEKSQTEKLLEMRMDPQELGRRQGFVRALRILSRQAPLSEQEIALRKSECSLLVDRNDADMRILNDGPNQ